MPVTDRSPAARRWRPIAEALWDDASFLGGYAGRLVPSAAARIRWAADAVQRPCHAVHRVVGAAGSLLYAGNDLQMRVALASVLGSRLRVETLDPVWGAGLAPGCSMWQRGADIIAVEITPGSARAFAGAGWLLLPRWLHVAVDLRTPEAELWDAKKRWFVRRIERSDLDLEVCDGASVARMFYDELYRPTALRRHGDHAFVRRHRFVARAAGRGQILFVRRAGERLAGMLLVPRLGERGWVDAWVAGVAGGDYERVDRLVREALYLHSIRWARDARAARTLGLTSAPPFLGDGLLRFKKRWGGRVYRCGGDRLVAVKISRVTDALLLRLGAFPIVHVSPDHGRPRLHATLVAEPGTDVAAAQSRFATPGVAPVEVVATAAELAPAELARRARACR